MAKVIPIETLIILQNQLNGLPDRSNKKKMIIKDTATLYGVSESTVYRALSKYSDSKTEKRSDYDCPRILEKDEMRKYCELVAAIKVRTSNKKGRCLSTVEAIRLIEEYGVETERGIIKAPTGLLKKPTVSRYLKRWNLDQKSMGVEPVVVRFQAEESNECWHFDLSPSDFKQFPKKINSDKSKLMLASVVDDRSGTMYQEYILCDGEDVITVLRFLFNAMAPKKNKKVLLQGIPKMLYIDNGSFSKSKVFKRVMSYIGVDVSSHMPKDSDNRRTTARSKGKVERPFRTVKGSLETLYHFHQPESLPEANEWLINYLIRYNKMSHRSEDHSRLEDWKINLPKNGFQEMCNWERFCSFCREPETRKVGSDAQISINGTNYQISPEFAGEEVTLLWGLFDNEIFIENEGKRRGPFYPSSGPIVLNQFRKYKKTDKEKVANKIAALAKGLSLPRSVLSGKDTTNIAFLERTNLLPEEKPLSVPFNENNLFSEDDFKSNIEAKISISGHLGYPLAKLNKEQMNFINELLVESLNKKIILKKVSDYFSSKTNKNRWRCA
jgi:hypothetical protein